MDSIYKVNLIKNNKITDIYVFVGYNKNKEALNLLFRENKNDLEFNNIFSDEEIINIETNNIEMWSQKYTNTKAKDIKTKAPIQ